ncbi:MAG: glycosyltransferase family 39 protein [Magnetospirillum sp.]|nr:glycosyltransferase family 39 protein [Magnetospirillum sp.]
MLGLLAIAMFAYPCLRVGTITEIDYNEGWNAYQQIRAMTGASLYSAETPYFINNYPPLSFYIVGLLGKLVGDVVLAGRLLSLLAVSVISLSVAVAVRAGGGRRPDSILAGLTILALLSGLATDYVGSNDPQLLAQGFVLAGFATYVTAGDRSGRMALVALLFACGLLCKHNVLCLPLVVSAHVLWRGSARGRAVYLGTGIALLALALAVIQWRFGAPFYQNLTASRLYDAARGVLLSIEVLDSLQAPVMASCLFLALRRETPIGGMVGAYLVGSLAIALAFSPGAGVDTNVFFDTMIACAMTGGLAVAWLRRQTGGNGAALAALAILFNAGPIIHSPIALGRMAVDLAGGELAERETLFQADIDWLRQVPGPALCESHLLCLRAGKPLGVDGYAVVQATATGRLPADTLTGMLARHEIAVAQISTRREHYPDEAQGAQAAPLRFVNFRDDVFDELDRSYKVARLGVTGRFYLPK